MKSELRDNCLEMHNALIDQMSSIKWLTIVGDRISPVKHLTLTRGAAERLSIEEINRIFDTRVDYRSNLIKVLFVYKSYWLSQELKMIKES